MNYLVTTFDGEPYLINYFDFENSFDFCECMVVYDLKDLRYTKDGKNWLPMEIKKHKYVK